MKTDGREQTTRQHKNLFSHNFYWALRDTEMLHNMNFVIFLFIVISGRADNMHVVMLCDTHTTQFRIYRAGLKRWAIAVVVNDEAFAKDIQLPSFIFASYTRKLVSSCTCLVYCAGGYSVATIFVEHVVIVVQHSVSLRYDFDSELLDCWRPDDVSLQFILFISPCIESKS